MLQIDRSSSKEDVSIRLRSKDPLFSKQLLAALAFSISIHALAAFIFDIRAPELMEHFAITPIVVEADPGAASEGNAGTPLPHMAAEGLMPRYVLEPEASVPDLPKMPTRAINRRLEQKKEKVPLAKQFYSLHKLPLPSEDAHFTFIQDYEPVDLKISGELGELPILEDGLSNFRTDLPRDEAMLSVSAKFFVQADGREGRVFWMQMNGSTGVAELDALAKTTVEKLRFTENPQLFLVQGEVEVHFKVREKGPYSYLLTPSAIISETRALP